ncbi:hypothetical protein JHK82_046525 [Glycine max]|uniref:Uncharacterized protein n=2 Tax=Glycine subgen. Soja TaxID=1462606 RepID=K7MJV1_SOYBN|nr:hypothetical protein JHK85_046968 [Glycine max]KHN03240.1 hypothetical protein glysoja_004266 [Glycine soja]KAG5096671.1 hypothetical protein JHK82_046525 [Glycine max]KAG5101460.1 hypothetical protein JHK84_046429 [Glycine max]KAH1116653.1 hypothetical protein GYH30_046177 [Glycine max]
MICIKSKNSMLDINVFDFVVKFATVEGLRSSVVSVLISLISDMWAIGPHDIKLLFLRGEANTVACYWVSRVSPCVAL